MSQKNTLIIDGKEFVFDYGSGTIYRDITLIPEATPGYLPLKGKETYPFKEIKNEIYFQIGKKFYKVVNKKEVLEITQEEYDEMKNYITINKNLNDPKVVQSYKHYVMAIVISEIIQEKYNKKISISVSAKELISRFIARFNPKINLDVDNLTRQIISILPKWINKDEKSKHIKEAYDEIVQEDKDNIRILLDNIYESSKDIFNAIYNSLLEEPIIEEIKRSSEDYNLNPIRTIRQKLLDLYFLYNDDKKGGILIPIEDLNCLIYKGQELHFDQNQIYYSDSEGIIKINGTENEFVSRSQVQLTGKDEVRFDSITEPSVELQFLNNVIAKINTVLKDKNVHR